MGTSRYRLRAWAPSQVRADIEDRGSHETALMRYSVSGSAGRALSANSCHHVRRWAVRLVPLDSQVLPPLGFGDQAYRCWETVAPYVPPRHVYSRRGRIKAGEGPGEQLRLELVRQGYETTGLTIQVDERDFEWTRVHRPRRNRHEATNTDRRGYQVSLTFDTPVSGPISLGHSSHFGLGLFVPLAD